MMALVGLRGGITTITTTITYCPHFRKVVTSTGNAHDHGVKRSNRSGGQAGRGREGWGRDGPGGGGGEGGKGEGEGGGEGGGEWGGEWGGGRGE